MKLVPVILSGGAGTRLWPASREAEPKPFILLPDGQSLLQKALQRAFAKIHGATLAEVLLVTNRDYLFRTVDERAKLPGGDYAPLRFILEPAARNTAPAIALAALAAAEVHGRDAILLVLPADHLINDIEEFQRAAATAVALAAEGRIVTFGVAPTRPEPGFGYIECGDMLRDAACTVTRFVEKPSVDTARGFIAAGNYAWNSGMFCYCAGSILDALARHAPDLARLAGAVWARRRSGTYDDYATIEFDAEAFAELPNLSIDYAVMERAANVACVRASFDWSDIGSWQALSDTLPADRDGNRQTGTAISI